MAATLLCLNPGLNSRRPRTNPAPAHYVGAAVVGSSATAGPIRGILHRCRTMGGCQQ